MNRWAHKKLATLLVVGLLLAAAGTAVAASEHAVPALIPNGAPLGYLSINHQTCKFVHPEIDVKPTPMERYARAEDSRDDVKMSCLANRKPPKATLQYKRVLAVGTGQSVTAGCPSGWLVFGGGSQSEVKGSYPATDDSWTVTRDAQSPTQLGAYAVCARLVS